ncbi:VCBS repeat-containing protein [Telluribacter sp. SYSU D00476]|uniref:VCBS repeat-containing protein n=1 Tax=Telluribacter sp. SYSU D00476 TaxID=2811430 RepID=UPI001FF2D6DE|nr:VCBS repeat-containing protein [Telluribacter sp. SYSU D00476]
MRSTLYPLLSLLALVSCTKATDTLFTSLPSSHTGIRFQNTIREDDHHNVFDFHPIYNGAGVACGDINNDGLPDLYFTGNMVGDRLYINKGNLQFEDITEQAGILKRGWSTGVTMADINADGLLDIYVSKSGNYGGEDRANQLYINKGNAVFEEIAASYGLADTTFTNHAAFFDFDKDGDLDVYLLTTSALERNTNKIVKVINDGTGLTPDKLYRNNGNNTFTDISREAGILHDGYGLGLAIADVNQDGYDDVLVSNDFLTNDHLYINNQNGTFSEASGQYFEHTSRFGMGNEVADFNNDGLLDVVQLDMLPQSDEQFKRMSGGGHYLQYETEMREGFQPQFMRNMLQLNLGKAPDGQVRFAEIGQLAGIHRTDWSWAPLLADFDSDGYKDLFVTNGYLRDVTDLDFIKYNQSYNPENATLEAFRKYITDKVKELPSWNNSNFFYRNRGDLTFEDVTEEWSGKVPSLSNGATYADLDNDGDLDIVSNNVNEEAIILRNDARAKNYLQLSLKGTDLNRFGLGATVTIYSSDKLQKQVLQPIRGYASSVDPRFYFGLGTSTRIDSLVIDWPDGKAQRLERVNANQHLVLDYKNATFKGKQVPAEPQPFVQELDLIQYTHLDEPYLDYNYDERMLPHRFSQQGPKMAKGDINGDGLDDIFIGGSYLHEGQFFVQNSNGSFSPQKLTNHTSVKNEEDVGVLLFDSDQDGDLDLYLVSGSNEYSDGSQYFQDRLYLNDGKGRFRLAPNRLPTIRHSGSCIKAADMDNDGDLDLFRGGRLTPSQFPVAGNSYVLRNDGGIFTDITPTVPSIRKAGMVTDAEWVDIDNDQWVDLVVVGEMMPIRIFKNNKGSLTPFEHNLKATEGFWNCIRGADFDQDGDIDFMVGNLGLNTRFRLSEKEPLTVYGKDFDGNGSFDAIPAYWANGKEVPMAGRDIFMEQLPTWRSRFQSYGNYSKATIQDILNEEQIRSSATAKAHWQESIYLENQGGGKFTIKKLPLLAQFAPIQSIAVTDINDDGHPDALLVGNDYSTEPVMGRYDAFVGLVLLGDSKGGFTPQLYLKTGFVAEGDCKDIVVLNDKYIVVSRNSDKVKLFQVQLYKPSIQRVIASK